MRFTSIAAVLAATASYAAADTCYAVAFSSGDETAAYQAGVLKALAQGAPTKTQYTGISGISGGAISAGILASYAPGQEAAAADRIIKFWTDASTSPMYKDWIGGLAQGLIIEGGLYNNKPLNQFLDTELADIGQITRFVNVGLANVLTGVWTDFDLTKNFMDVMKGSFAYAGMFAPMKAMNSEWFDGSSIWDIDIFSAVNKCLETHKPEDVHVDVILTSEKHLKVIDPTQLKTVGMVWRFLHVNRYYNQMDGLLRAQFAYPTIDMCVISPDQSLDDGILPLNFDTKAINAMVALGEADGHAALTNGCSANTKAHMQYYTLKKKQDGRLNGMDFATFKEQKAAGKFEEFVIQKTAVKKPAQFLV